MNSKNYTFLMALLFTISQSIIAQNHADRSILADSGYEGESTNRKRPSAQKVDVTERDITIPGIISANATEDFTAPVYRYAFDKGDQILINLHMRNRKGTNNLEVFTYPDKQMIYNKKNFTHLKDIKIPVRKKSIYLFRFTSNHTFDRQANLTIKRIPGSSAKSDFNTDVIFKEAYKAVTVQSPQRFYINSTSNKKFKKGKDRVVLPIVLPPNTEKWYFEYAVSRDQQYINQVQKSLNLWGQLSKLIDQSGFLQFTIGQITRPPGVNIADVYLMNHENANYFLADHQHQYYLEGTRENYQDGVVEVSTILENGLYLGLRNRDPWHGIHIAVEVVAIVKSEGWVMNEN